jgi:hypothetical protein
MSGMPACKQPRRAPDVAVVEADHAVAALDQLGAEVVLPEDHLGAEAHDEEERTAVLGAEVLVLDVDVAYACGRACVRSRME